MSTIAFNSSLFTSLHTAGPFLELRQTIKKSSDNTSIKVEKKIQYNLLVGFKEMQYREAQATFLKHIQYVLCKAASKMEDGLAKKNDKIIYIYKMYVCLS